MYVIDVIPITRRPGKDHLSYYTPHSTAPGSLVSVPVRRGREAGLVTACDPVSRRKAELRASSYSLRKVEQLDAQAFLDPGLVRAAADTARFFATSIGRVLSHLLPAAVLEAPRKLHSPPSPNGNAVHEKYLLQTHPDERSAHYKSLIREDLAQKRSVMVCLPTIEDVAKATRSLEKGIESYTYVFHGELSKTEIRRRWNNALSESHPILIVATPMFLSLPRHDLGTIILERENAPQFKTARHPIIDMRTAAEYISYERGVRLVFGDTLLRVETIWRHNNLEFMEYMPLKYRSLTSAESHVLDMRSERTETDSNEASEPFRVLSDTMAECVQHTVAHNERMLLFASRRGIAPITICGDCGTPVSCEHCQAPMVLHEPVADTPEYNFFQCHTCGRVSSAHTTCRECGDWRLVALGIGTERVRQEARALAPEERIFTIDADHTRTHKQAQKQMEQFMATPGSILITTEKGLLYLPETIEHVGVASLDSLFSIPDFRINERIMHLLTSMRLAAHKQFMIQTRQPEQPVLSYGRSGDLINFYRDEIAMRQQLGYPPFTTLIKIARRGKRDRVEKDMEAIATDLGSDRIQLYPSSATTRSRYVLNGLIKVPRETWIDESLCAYLRSLPPQFAVTVDPYDIL